jgi:tetratricopeptide (TPR) repeat protein
MVHVFHAVLLVVAQAGNATSGIWTSGRPPECSAGGGRAGNVWERAKSPELRRYCDLVASASSKLAGIGAMAEPALAAAREADGVLPGHAAPHVLQGRALCALGRYDEALEAFSASTARDPHALDDPPALLAFARALARTGRVDAAADAYRALLPRSSALSTSGRVSAEVEAGLVAMARGRAGLDEAEAALREALREAQDEAQAVAVLALALALDRNGSAQNAQEARALLAERAHGDPREALGSARAKELLAVAVDETHALAALALEGSDPTGARDQWQRAVDDAPRGPWAAHAKAHLLALASAPAARASAGGRSPGSATR